MRKATQLVDLLNSISPDGECWIWPFAKSLSGYGNVYFDGKNRYVHRVVFFLINGRWPSPLSRHTCDNKSCFNPLHIAEGNKSQNAMDAICRQGLMCGEKSGHAKLTEYDVRSIRSLYASGKGTTHIARQFKISLPTVCDIAFRRTWRHI